MVYESHILFIKLVIIAAFAGGLLGVEREMMHKAVAGTRTFMLTSILGVLSVYIASQTSQIFLSITLVGIFLIAILIGIIKNFMNDDIGITTVSAFIMAFMIGIIIGLGRPIEGVAMSIIATAILTSKKYSQELSKTMTFEEMKNALEFGFIAFVLYPLLPDRVIGPLGVINPRTMLLVVIIVTLIGFVGFIALRRYGAEVGLPLTGVLGGLVNSQATVSALSIKAKAESALETFALQGILLANTGMLLRNIAIAAAIDLKVAHDMLIPISAMMIAAVILAFHSKTKQKEKKWEHPPVESPFAIKPAVKFGVFFVLVSFIVKISQSYGTGGVYVTSAIAGLVSSGAAVAGLANLAASGNLSPSVAGTAGILSIIASLMSKIFISKFSGTATLTMKVTEYIIATVTAGIALLILTTLF